MKRHIIIACVFSLYLFFYGTIIGSAQSTNRQFIDKAHCGECNSCHGTDNKLPDDHISIGRMNLKQCMECHENDVPMLVNTLPLSHSHLLSGVSCKACHGDENPPQFVESTQCITCHKPGDLVVATEGHKEANPHNSHYGPELDCDLCHHVHSKSENYCNQCHDFNFVIPSPMLGTVKE